MTAKPVLGEPASGVIGGTVLDTYQDPFSLTDRERPSLKGLWPHRREVVLTREGRHSLERRLERLARELATYAERLREEGSDPQTRAEYERTLSEFDSLTDVLRRARNLDDVREDPEIVELGDEVVIEYVDGERDTFLLVDPSEAAVDDGRISIASPLAVALLGRRVGAEVEVEAPAGTYPCVIVARRRSS